jgi:acylphosphatase
MADVRRHVLITGYVQGIFFRASTRARARELGLSGWVRNRSDGRVEAVFQGPFEAVEEMVRWCHEGPPGAQVTSVEVREEQPEPGPQSFAVLRTV